MTGEGGSHRLSELFLSGIHRYESKIYYIDKILCILVVVASLSQLPPLVDKGDLVERAGWLVSLICATKGETIIPPTPCL
jgi:hypothetical protein